VNPRGLLVFLGLSVLPCIVAARTFWHAYPGDLFAPNHQLVVRDYLYMWAGGHLARDGRLDTIFDPHAFAAWLWSVFGTRLDLHTWGFPPPMLFIAIPFSWLPLVSGFLIWVVATSALLWIVLRAGRMPAAYVFAVVLSPVALANALVGQNGAILTAALAGGLLLCQRTPMSQPTQMSHPQQMSQGKPMLAGALLGLLVLKPQLGLLVPVCLLARRDWWTILWTAIFASGYCALSLAAFGWAAWREYLTVCAPFVRHYIDAPFGLATHYTMVPPFITMRAAGASLAWSYGVQTAVTVLSAVLAWWSWSRRHADHRLAVALVLCLAPLATPYAHDYDAIGVAVACALMVQIARETGDADSRECLLLVPAWLWPGCALMIGVLFLPGLGAFCVASAAVLAVLYIRRADCGPMAGRVDALPDPHRVCRRRCGYVGPLALISSTLRKNAP
jgi:hypothetical protein